jgi:glycosyltransferase involved in cell wall biosynthesis
MSSSESSRSRIEAVGIIVPVHNEEGRIALALHALESAIRHPALVDLTCRIVVVLDSCRDRTPVIVKRWARGLNSTDGHHGAVIIECRTANVGRARQIGCAELLRRWSTLEPRHIWFATTDSDSEVPTDWLAVQLARHGEGFDLWAGRVAVVDWSGRSDGTAHEWNRRYEAETAPIHGANLGVSADIYLDAGGFSPLPTGEDRALHRAIAAIGGAVCYDHLAPVVTSARRHARAPYGFAHRLTTLEAGVATVPVTSDISP